MHLLLRRASRNLDDEVDLTADTSRNQLIDRGIDCGVLAADASPVKKRAMKKYHGANANAVATVALRYTTRVRMNSFLRPTRVGELTEEQGAQTCACDVDRRGDTYLACGQFDSAAGLSTSPIAASLLSDTEYPPQPESPAEFFSGVRLRRWRWHR